MQQQVSRKRFTFRVVLGLTLAVLLIYGETLGAGFTFWDDDVYVTRNPLIQELSPGSVGRLFTQFSNCNYHPLTYFTWMAEYSLVGLSPWLYHLDNVLLHVGVGVLVFLLTRRLLEGAHGELAALLVAVLFLVHPLRVESVAWIAERKDVLCVLFYLASLLVYLKFIDEGPDKRSYGLSLALFLAALLSKAMAISLPAVQVLLLVLRRSASRKQLLLLAPFWVLSVVFAVLAYLAQAACGAVTPIHGDTFLAHLLTVVKALAFYAQKLVVPHPLSARYVVEPAAGLGEPQVIVGLILVALATWAAWRSFGRRRLLFFGLGFFAVTWAPVSGIVPTSTLVADRYMYLPALGLLWPLGAAAGAALRGAVESRRHATAWVGLTLLLGTALVWGVLARERVHAWTDGIVLWQDA
ncbi:MAG: hypothetical protein O7J95_14110, partial [Planctomycetota bacterium]|nr:hypothetical protein [Planctomycetota bacterium]